MNRRKKQMLRKTAIPAFMRLVLAVVLCIAGVEVVKIISSDTLKNPDITPNSDIITSVSEPEQSSSESSSPENVNENLTLVNSTHTLPEGFSPELTTLTNGKQVASEIYPDLQAMFNDMRSQGIYPVVGEGYRTHAEQQQMLDDKINAYLDEGYSYESAVEMAEQYVALPGTSEHELGLAVDINADDTLCSNEEVYQWLADNAYRYGFILRYPEGKLDITGIEYEPWHYRWVGNSAEEIYSRQLSLEEYLES